MPDRSTGNSSDSRLDGALADPLEEVVDPEEFTPRLLALLSNALVWRESRELRRSFNLGTNEWRILSSIASRPGMSATEVSEFLVMNKATISKSMATLVQRGLILLSAGPRGSRPMYLTAAGAEMHRRMLPISVRGQDIIREGLTADDAAALNALLRRMLSSLRAVESLESEERSLTAG